MGGTLTKEGLFHSIEISSVNNIRTILLSHPEFANEPFNADAKTLPLSRAAWRGDIKVMDTLLIFGAKVNQQEIDGETALIWAAKNGKLKALELLLSKEADATIECKQGFNCLDYAIIYNNYECALYLFNKCKLEIKGVESFNTFAEENNKIKFNYELLINHLLENTAPKFAPSFELKNEKKKFKDPVIDPRESWKEFIGRVINFGEPPIVERNELPEHLQPQNSFLGRIGSYFSLGNQTTQNVNTENANPLPKKNNKKDEEEDLVLTKEEEKDENKNNSKPKSLKDIEKEEEEEKCRGTPEAERKEATVLRASNVINISSKKSSYD